MQLAANVFDVWAFRRTAEGIRFLLLHTSVEKAERFFNGGRFWQIPSDVVKDGEHITDAIARHLRAFGLKAQSVWAAEHTYTIYNRRFNEMQLIGVYAAEVLESAVRLNAGEHAEYQWLSLEECLGRVHFRGLKDGVRSVHEYITGVDSPARELCLYSADAP
ncbi:MAG TPA: NUDIX domain-containing protein [Steroidobacteraceae bacterium]|nr:NUDIX domain-containing protein [Steroidobacteraceae bacterium]